LRCFLVLERKGNEPNYAMC